MLQPPAAPQCEAAFGKLPRDPALQGRILPMFAITVGAEWCTDIACVQEPQKSSQAMIFWHGHVNPSMRSRHPSRFRRLLARRTSLSPTKSRLYIWHPPFARQVRQSRTHARRRESSKAASKPAPETYEDAMAAATSSSPVPNSLGASRRISDGLVAQKKLLNASVGIYQ